MVILEILFAIFAAVFTWQAHMLNRRIHSEELIKNYIDATYTGLNRAQQYLERLDDYENFLEFNNIKYVPILNENDKFFFSQMEETVNKDKLTPKLYGGEILSSAISKINDSIIKKRQGKEVKEDD